MKAKIFEVVLHKLPSWGEPSVTDHVSRVFDSSRVLLTVLIDPGHFANVASSPMGSASATAHQQGGAMAALSAGLARPMGNPPAAQAQFNAEQETALDSLKPLLSGNTPLTARLFRALFEHMLGFALQSTAQQGSISLANELTGSKEHGRSFLSTALFILGAEL